MLVDFFYNWTPCCCDMLTSADGCRYFRPESLDFFQNSSEFFRAPGPKTVSNHIAPGRQKDGLISKSQFYVSFYGGEQMHLFWLPHSLFAT